MNESVRLSWNRRGWLGGQVGGSCWMLVAGLLSIPANLDAAIAVLGLFALANFLGWLVWRRRESLSPYKGLQMLIPILGAIGIAAVYVLDSAGIYESIQVGASVTASETIAVLIGVVVVLMIMFWWQDRQHKKQQ
ncbi:MAG: hypothetical protein O7D88_06705 [Gammaproteobacteria bacterium]|nr:hypothetical protein [Gammaproteobacteria bacterium]